MESRGLAIRIVQKEGSLLSKEMLMDGHRLAKDAVVKLWLADIESGKFTVERNPDFRVIQAPKKRSKRSKAKSQKRTSLSSTEDEGEP
ncbi:uncharacterized protein MELLADRAFT_73572, partial [Melampsora larici-populina 98AG31]